MPLAKVLPFARPDRLAEELLPGDRVVGTDADGNERVGTVVSLGEEGAGGLEIGPPGTPRAHLVSVAWCDPEMVDAAALRLV